MSAFVKKTSKEREEELLASDVTDTPHGTREAMSRELGKFEDGDYTYRKELFAEDPNKPTEAMARSAQYIEKVKALPTTIQSGQEATTSAPANNDGKEQGGGVLEFFGLAGGRKRRRKKSRKRKRKSKKKRRKSRKKRRRRKRGGLRWGNSGEKTVGQDCSWSMRGSECGQNLRCINKKCVKVEDGSAQNVGVGDIPAAMAMKTFGLLTGKKTAGGGKSRRKKRRKSRKKRRKSKRRKSRRRRRRK